MRASASALLAPIALVGLLGCPPQPEPEPECALDLDNLAGTTWVMNEALQDGSTSPNPQARGFFYEEEGELKLKYTIKSALEVFEYSCKRREDQLICRDENNILGWCAALEGHELGSCTKSRLRDLGAKRETDEELLEAMRQAKEAAEQAASAGQGEAFSAVNNNLGNKLQGVVYINVQEGCRMVFIDNYRTLYNGRWVEDSNPVGTNPFVQAEGDYLMETCTDVGSVVATTTAERPTARPEPTKHPIGQQLYYHYAGTESAQAAEGCTYELEAYAQWQQFEQRAVTAGEDGNLNWLVNYTWSDLDQLKRVDPVNPSSILTVVRYKTCAGGERELIDTQCSVAVFEGGTAPPAPAEGEGEGEEEAAE